MQIEKVCDIARQAGEAILDIYNGEFEVEFKEDKSPLTAADKASHEVIVTGLRREFPDLPILSEEAAAVPYEERQTWETFWLVDPLDGTKEFIKRNGEFTVNIALISGGVPVAGVVYVPVQDKLYCGIVGEGARVITDSLQLTADSYSQAREIHVREPNHVAGLTVVMSRSHPSPELEEYLKQFKVADVLPVGSSLKLCVVAEGLADLYPRLGPTMEWDTAAGHAVALAAGASVTTPEGKPLHYNKENLLNPYFIVQGVL